MPKNHRRGMTCRHSRLCSRSLVIAAAVAVASVTLSVATTVASVTVAASVASVTLAVAASVASVTFAVAAAPVAVASVTVSTAVTSVTVPTAVAVTSVTVAPAVLEVVMEEVGVGLRPGEGLAQNCQHAEDKSDLQSLKGSQEVSSKSEQTMAMCNILN